MHLHPAAHAKTRLPKPFAAHVADNIAWLPREYWLRLHPMARAASRQQEAAATLRTIIAKVERGDLLAPRWYVERLRGAIAALDHRRPKV